MMMILTSRANSLQDLTGRDAPFCAGDNVVEHGEDHAVGGHNITNSSAKHSSLHGNYQDSQVRSFDRTAVLTSSVFGVRALMRGSRALDRLRHVRRACVRAYVCVCVCVYLCICPCSSEHFSLSLSRALISASLLSTSLCISHEHFSPPLNVSVVAGKLC